MNGTRNADGSMPSFGQNIQLKFTAGAPEASAGKD